MLKRVDVAVYDYINASVDGKCRGGQEVFDLKVDGVGYADHRRLQSTTSRPSSTSYRQQIIGGQITVPTTRNAGAGSHGGPASRSDRRRVRATPARSTAAGPVHRGAGSLSGRRRARSCRRSVRRSIPSPPTPTSRPAPRTRGAPEGEATMAATGGPAASPAGTGATAPPYAVELRGITKRFPGVVANDDIDLAVRRGEVHALVGENGAGKSTLMKILYGMQQPGRGHDPVDGARGARSAARRRDRGRDRHGAPALHARRQPHRRRRTSCSARAEPRRPARPAPGPPPDRASSPTGTGSRLDPDELVEDLGVGDRQRVEILKVLYRGARTLILDEPTAVLVPQEVDELFATLRELKREGYRHVHLAQARRGAARSPTRSP